MLVVGSAQSGAQIADELAAAGRSVFLATGACGRLPRRYRGHDISVWLELAGLYDVPRQEFVEADGRVAGRPTLGALRTISLQSLSAAGVTLLGHFTGVDGGRLRFADDLAEHIRLGDEGSAATKRKIDAYIESAGIERRRRSQTRRRRRTRLPHPPSTRSGRGRLDAVIWCTGLTGGLRLDRLRRSGSSGCEPIHDGSSARYPASASAGSTSPSTVAPEQSMRLPRKLRASRAPWQPTSAVRHRRRRLILLDVVDERGGAHAAHARRPGPPASRRSPARPAGRRSRSAAAAGRPRAR